MNIKFATFNIGRLYVDFDAYIKIISETIKEYSPDYLFLQEYVPSDGLKDAIETASGLKFRFYDVLSESHVSVGDKMGIAVFSNLPIEKKACYKLIKPDHGFIYNGKTEYFHDKYFMVLDSEFNGSPLRFITGHGYSFNRYGLLPTDEEFAPIFSGLDEWLSKNINDNTVAIGDFNMDCAETVLPKLSEKLVDVFCGLPTRPSGRKTDFIMVNPRCSVVKKVIYSCGCYRPLYGLDHNYIACEVNFKK